MLLSLDSRMSYWMGQQEDGCSGFHLFLVGSLFASVVLVVVELSAYALLPAHFGGVLRHEIGLDLGGRDVTINQV